MITRDEAVEVLDAEVHLILADQVDAGPVRRVYLDDYTGWPSFCTVDANTGGRETFVALHEATVSPDGVIVPYDRATVDQAPRVEEDRDLSLAEEDALFDYYGVPIDNVAPQVEHLGAVLVTEPDRDVTIHRIDHPDDTVSDRAVPDDAVSFGGSS